MIGEPECFDPTIPVIIIIVVAVSMAIVIGVVVSAKKRSQNIKVNKNKPSAHTFSTSYQPRSFSSSTPSTPNYVPIRDKPSGMFDELNGTTKTPVSSSPYHLQTEAPKSDKRKVCPQCGVEWGPEAIFCGECGYKFI